MTRSLRIPVLGLLLALLGTPVHAQSLARGSIAGAVQDETGERLHDAAVTLVDLQTGTARSTVTGRDGSFELRLLPPGAYEVRVERFGYQPLRIQGVSVEPGRRVQLPATLSPTAPPVDRAEIVSLAGGATPRSLEQRLSWQLDALPDARRDLSQVLHFSSLADASFHSEGLPRRFHDVRVDGVRLGGTPLDAHWGAGPLGAVQGATLRLAEVDVETGGGALLHAHTLRGTRELRVQAFGDWSGDALASGADATPATFSAPRGGVLVSGPLVADTAHFVFGVERVRSAVSLPASWETDSVTTRVLAVARDSFGVTLDRYARPFALESEALSTFGRVDWQVTGDHELSVRAHWTSFPTLGTPSSDPEGQELAAAATLVSRFGERVAQELRFGYESTIRNFAGIDPLASTLLLERGLRAGSSLVEGRYEQSTLLAENAVHLLAGAHHLKAGAALELASYDYSYGGRGGEFFFGSVERFASGEGYFRERVGPHPTAQFAVPRYSAFLQDQWLPTPELELTAGLRYTLEQLPRGEIRRNESWTRQSGVANDALPDVLHQVSPRASFAWDVGGRQRWMVDGSVGLFHEPADPFLLGELIVNDGDLRLRQGYGLLAGWPLAPDSLQAPAGAPILSLAGEDFAAPRTVRSSLGITHRRGVLSLQLAGTFRRTDRLSRRVDLNRLEEPPFLDQDGRPVHGRLVQHGALVVGQPGSGRRFADFDQVTALNTDGVSEYWGVTAAVERDAGALRFFGRYTFSNTRDNVLSPVGTPEAQLNPFPGGFGGGDWTEGRSDFDVPHRAAAGAELRVPGRFGPRLAAAYRYRSGLPFTPTFRDGVDANGDGSALNDPAFVSEGVPGMDVLVGEWDCLRGETGRFVQRNACRGESVHALDGRLRMEVLRGTRLSASVLVDALNLLHSEIGEVDRALYLVDESRMMEQDEAGAFRLPLIANPDFGQLLVRRTPARVFRLGLQLRF